MGDWNGDGVDTIGVAVVSGGQWVWQLRDYDSDGLPNYSFAYGGGTAIPVTGDWDASRDDSIGVVVRSGCCLTWVLRDFKSSGLPTIPEFSYGAYANTPVPGNWDAQ